VLGPLDGKRTEYFDEALPGFSLRVAASGRKSFCVLYRSGRRLRRYTLGGYPVLGLARARELARSALAEAALGGDPALQKVERRRALSFAALSTEYLELHARPNKKTWREDERRIRKTLLPAFRHVPATDVKRAHVRDLIDEILVRGAPYEANRTHALLRKMFNWAVARDLVERSPVAGLPRPAKERRRQHVLREDEVRRFWQALDPEPPAVAASLKLRLYTAQRGGEVRTMQWDDVELETGWWTIPEERAKNDLSHRVFLVPAALSLLPAPTGSPWVFPNRDGTGPMLTAQKSIERVRERAGIELRGHDLRRTAASHMASIGVPRLVIAKILNHVDRSVTAIYDRYSYDREKRQAMEAWARRLGEILAFDGRARAGAPELG
jgi:integrase